MSTRSNIGILNADGTVRACYIHFDGYPTGVGAELLADFDTPEKINARLDKGNGSSLYDGFYKDRGDEGAAATVFKTKNEYLEDHVYAWVEYQYLYEDGEWFVYKVPVDEGRSVMMGDLRNVVALENKRLQLNKSA